MTLARIARQSAVNSRSGLATATLAVGLVFTLVPLLYLVSVSLMDRAEITSGIVVSADPKWQNWADVLAGSPIPRAILNSFIAAVLGAALTLAFALPGAWAIVRYRTGGRTLAATLMSPWLLPPIVAVIPIMTLLRTLDLANTLAGLTIVYALVNIPVAVWLLEGFIRKLPIEIDEAAQLDGAGSWRVLLSIVTPLVAPALVAVGIIVAILNYHEFLLATFLTQSADSQTLTVVLSLFLGERLAHTGKIAAAAVIGILPLFALATVMQRWLVEGLTSGSVK
ncbi:carbohydrate ABC transporter permease [Salinibacterium sp. SYSU T00001]|uniref:carbohydrate ABC transporter permease n=1 Tax=Homoserinimonas sedimenticola TaxID=2986805 RepID=UPI0022356228|nr:carbohydrate ABC transporter permease [Salinibacterium sedimenticola]MCW4386380.1 carbohydrate ABC transporter permease [Salinibacterium sedimenticola]